MNKAHVQKWWFMFMKCRLYCMKQLLNKVHIYKTLTCFTYIFGILATWDSFYHILFILLKNTFISCLNDWHFQFEQIFKWRNSCSYFIRMLLFYLHHAASICKGKHWHVGTGIVSQFLFFLSWVEIATGSINEPLVLTVCVCVVIWCF